MSYHIEKIPNRKYRPTILLRKAWREGKKIKKKKIANLTHMPEPFIQALQAMLKGGMVIQKPEDIFSMEQAYPHGHVACLYGLAKRLGLDKMLEPKPSRTRALALASIIMRAISPLSKLATARQLSEETTSTSLGKLLGLGSVHGNEVLAMLSWLADRQNYMERSLARRHLKDGTMLLYDVSSSYFEGDKCDLAAFGYSRDKRKDKKQIVFGLLCSRLGCPIGIEVFSGTTADPNTLQVQMLKIKKRFGLHRVVLVGDRGMLTSARIDQELKPHNLDWITALRNRDIRRLLAEDLRSKSGVLIEDVIDVQEECIGELSSKTYPGERFMVCKNPSLMRERREKRERLLELTDKLLGALATKVSNGTVSGADYIGKKIGQEIAGKKMLKHYDLEISDSSLVWRRNEAHIRKEEALDGIYVIRTSVAAEAMDASQVVASYKSLALVERAFRTIKTVSIRVRPIYVYKEEHVRGHVFLCMLSYYLEWHMRQELAPLLFVDQDKDEAEKKRENPVAKAEQSDSVIEKLKTKKTVDGYEVNSFKTLMEHLSSFTMNKVFLPLNSKEKMYLYPKPTPIQQKAFDLLKIDPKKFVPSKVIN